MQNIRSPRTLIFNMASQSKDKAPPINVKLLLIGNSSVGKSSLLLRFSDEQWLPEDEASATIGVDFRVCSLHTSRVLLFLNRYPQVHKMEVKGRKVKLSIWVSLRIPCDSY